MESLKQVNQVNIIDEASEWLRKDIMRDKVETITFLAQALSSINPGTRIHRDVIERIMQITADAGKIDPVQTIDALSKSFLWVGREYITSFAALIVTLENPALNTDPNAALAALERILMVCYCAILPKDIHGYDKVSNEYCIEWQRRTFFSIINTVETKPHIDPMISSGVLKISEMMTDVSGKLTDINQRIKFIAHANENLSWH
ncbi:MAG TPA: hypothetical protein VFT64_05870 [Rickettsiales bacterium]|nr:hypothetical protein [Rickettsiales bacterium]